MNRYRRLFNDDNMIVNPSRNATEKRCKFHIILLGACFVPLCSFKYPKKGYIKFHAIYLLTGEPLLHMLTLEFRTFKECISYNMDALSFHTIRFTLPTLLHFDQMRHIR